MNTRRLLSASIVLALVLAGGARAEENGLADLDEATQLRLKAETFADLGKIVELCESALDKGLSDENKAFAVRLIGATLMQRAQAAAGAIFQVPPDPRWPQLRSFALGDIERALKHDPKLSEAHLLGGRLHLLPGGDREKAKKSLDEAINTATDDAMKAQAYLARAEVHSEVKDQLADLDEAVKLAPKNVDAVRTRGMLHFNQGNHEAALADFAAAIELAPDRAELYETRGLTYVLMSKYDEALADFNRAIELAPTSAGLRAQRARVYALQGHNDKALTDLDEALKIDPRDLMARLMRARVHQLMENLDSALEDVETMLRQRPGLIAAIELRAALFAAQGNFDRAIEDLRRLVEDQPDNADRRFQLALVYTAAKKPSKAIEQYNVLIERDAGNWRALYGRGDALLSIGKHKEAVADYEVAVKIEPDNSGILNNFAWVLATSPDDEVRNGERSIEFGKRAAELTEFKRPHVLSTLAAGYAEAGQWDEAVKWSEKAFELGKELDDGELREQLAAELESYKQKKPWRERQNIEAEADGEQKPENKPDQEPESKPEQKPGQKPEPKSEQKPDEEPEPESEQEPNQKSEQEPKPEQEPDQDE